MNRTFVLVSQGIEIHRTRNQEEALEMVTKMNKEYSKYLEECDELEAPVDNYVELHIEYDEDKKASNKNSFKTIKEKRLKDIISNLITYACDMHIESISQSELINNLIEEGDIELEELKEINKKFYNEYIEEYGE